jgi:hypothetical protein
MTVYDCPWDMLIEVFMGALTSHHLIKGIHRIELLSLAIVLRRLIIVQRRLTRNILRYLFNFFLIFLYTFLNLFTIIFFLFFLTFYALFFVLISLLESLTEIVIILGDSIRGALLSIAYCIVSKHESLTFLALFLAISPKGRL